MFGIALKATKSIGDIVETDEFTNHCGRTRRNIFHLRVDGTDGWNDHRAAYKFG